MALTQPRKLLVWSGDNPCSAVGLGLIHEGKVAISLGTSYTYFGRMQQRRVDVRGEGSVFGAPTGDYLPLICFTNGSLAFEKIRNQYGLDWEGYNQLLLKTEPGNQGAIVHAGNRAGDCSTRQSARPPPFRLRQK